MNGGKRIVAFGSSHDNPEPDAAPAHGAPEPETRTETETAATDVAEPEVPPAPRYGWVVSASAALAIGAWSVVFVLARAPANLHALTLPLAVDLVGGWALPVAVVLLALLVARTQLRDASRHAAVIHALAYETRALDRQLRAINTELSLARDFVAGQARDLDALGRIATDRLNGSAERLSGALTGQRRDIDHIAHVSSKVLENLETLRGHLPVVSNAAKDMANSIAHVGQTADTQLDDLIAGFNRLNEFGVATGRKVDAVQSQVETALESFAGASERIAHAGETRLQAVSEALHAQAAELAQVEDSAMRALAARIATLDADMRQLAKSAARAIADLGHDHETLLGKSRERLRRFEEGAHAIGRALLDEQGHVDEALQARRHALEAAAGASADALTARLEAIDGAIGQRRAAMVAAAADASDAIETRLAAIDAAIAAQRRRQIDAVEKLAATSDVLVERVAALSQTLDSGRAAGEQGAAALGAALDTLAARLARARGALGDSERTIAGLTDAAVRLLELIHAASDHTTQQLPQALGSATAGLESIEARVVRLRDSLREAGQAAAGLAGDVDGADARLRTVPGEIAAIGSALAANAGQTDAVLGALRTQLRAAQAEGDSVAGAIERRLAGAIADLEEAAHRTGDTLGANAESTIAALAARLGEATNAAVAQVLQGRGSQLVARLETAIDSVQASAHETAVSLRDQLLRIDELAANLEARVTRAREQAEETVDNDFARRTALISESLNSTAIDLVRILSSEVSDSAWASYLRGERGIFTRRAVALLDATEARVVQQHYETDAEFRAHVNRYVHDFEAMLRQLLSTRDGNALGVTLLSSDMGKLYVTLAQGIERLRT